MSRNHYFIFRPTHKHTICVQHHYTSSPSLLYISIPKSRGLVPRLRIRFVEAPQMEMFRPRQKGRGFNRVSLRQHLAGKDLFEWEKYSKAGSFGGLPLESMICPCLPGEVGS